MNKDILKNQQLSLMLNQELDINKNEKEKTNIISFSENIAIKEKKERELLINRVLDRVKHL